MAKNGLDKWFKQKWVDIGSKRKDGSFAPCGRSKQKKDAKRKYPKCVKHVSTSQLSSLHLLSRSLFKILLHGSILLFPRKRTSSKTSNGVLPSEIFTKGTPRNLEEESKNSYKVGSSIRVSAKSKTTPSLPCLCMTLFAAI